MAGLRDASNKENGTSGKTSGAAKSKPFEQTSGFGSRRTTQPRVRPDPAPRSSRSRSEKAKVETQLRADLDEAKGEIARLTASDEEKTTTLGAMRAKLEAATEAEKSHEEARAVYEEKLAKMDATLQAMSRKLEDLGVNPVTLAPLKAGPMEKSAAGGGVLGEAAAKAIQLDVTDFLRKISEEVSEEGRRH